MFHGYFAEILEALSSSTTTSQDISTIGTTDSEQFTKATTAYNASSISCIGYQSTRPMISYASSFSLVKPTTTSTNSVPQVPQGLLYIVHYIYIYAHIHIYIY